MPSPESAKPTGIHINKVFVIAVLIDLVLEDGPRVPRERGTPQSGVISPLLANLFLHYVFACWLSRHWLSIPFACYADDVVCHCQSAEQAQQVIRSLEAQFEGCGLRLHPDKTRIVYCKGGRRTGDYPQTSFYTTTIYLPPSGRRSLSRCCLVWISQTWRTISSGRKKPKLG